MATSDDRLIPVRIAVNLLGYDESTFGYTDTTLVCPRCHGVEHVSVYPIVETEAIVAAIRTAHGAHHDD